MCRCVYIIHVHMWECGHLHATTHMWRSEANHRCWSLHPSLFAHFSTFIAWHALVYYAPWEKKRQGHILLHIFWVCVGDQQMMKGKPKCFRGQEDGTKAETSPSWDSMCQQWCYHVYCLDSRMLYTWVTFQVIYCRIFKEHKTCSSVLLFKYFLALFKQPAVRGKYRINIF